MYMATLLHTSGVMNTSLIPSCQYNENSNMEAHQESYRRSQTEHKGCFQHCLDKGLQDVEKAKSHAYLRSVSHLPQEEICCLKIAWIGHRSRFVVPVLQMQDPLAWQDIGFAG